MKLKTFPAGIHPPDNKQGSAHLPVEECSLPQELVVPLSQHIGAPADACVEKGDKVGKGQVIGNAKGFVSVPVHAPTSGEVIAVEPRLHPTGRALPSVVISADGEDAWTEDLREADPENLSPDEIRDRIRAAGIVGMGGAAFPAAVKLNSPRPVDTLILNGGESEPYLTCDDRLMRERPKEILQGASIIAYSVGAKRIVVAIEANKWQALSAMLGASAGWPQIEVVAVENRYPMGAEKQLIVSVSRNPQAVGGLGPGMRKASTVSNLIGATEGHHG